jgi:chromosome segregation ATPase
MTVPPPLTLEERLLEYKPGSIRRIKLKNFLTYNEVEFRPGARLNVVIGPNGTGKSTILCAICLGLGGQPPLLGRADDARLFIMHEKDIAEIEIEIAPFPDKETHVVRRVIDRNKGATGKRSRGIAASSYYINGREVKADEIRSLVSDVYNIAIDNLCTFLPQDRVGSFSGFDSKQLLLETEKSVSASGLLYDQHMKLIELEEQMLSSDSNVISVQEVVRTLEADVSRLQHQKDMMEDRNEAMKQLDLIKKKLLWTEFDLAREEGIRLKEEKKQKKLELQNAQSNQQPIKDEIAKIQHLASKNSQRKTVLQKQLDSLNRDHDKTIKRAEKHNEMIESDMSDLNSMSALIRRAQEEVIVKRRNLEHAESLLKEFPPAEEIDAAIMEAQEEFKIEKRRHNEAKTKVQELQL